MTVQYGILAATILACLAVAVVSLVRQWREKRRDR